MIVGLNFKFGVAKEKVHVAAILDECTILWGEPERVQ